MVSDSSYPGDCCIQPSTLHPLSFFPLFRLVFLIRSCFTSCFLWLSFPSGLPFTFHHCCRWLTLPTGTWEFSPRDSDWPRWSPLFLFEDRSATPSLWHTVGLLSLLAAWVAPAWCPGAAGMRAWKVGAGHSCWMHTSGCCFWGGFRKDDSPSERGLGTWHLACSVSTEEC